MNNLRLFERNRTSSDERPAYDAREYVVYLFFIVAVTAVIAVWTHWSVKGGGVEIGIEVLFGFYSADWLIAKFRKRQ